MSVHSFGFLSPPNQSSSTDFVTKGVYSTPADSMTSGSPNPRMGVLPPASGPHQFSKMFAAAAAAASAKANPNFSMPDQTLTQQLLAQANPQAMQSAWFHLQQRAFLAARDQQTKLTSPPVDQIGVTTSESAEEDAAAHQQIPIQNGHPEEEKKGEDGETVVKTEEKNEEDEDQHQVRKKARVESIVSSFHQADDGRDQQTNDGRMDDSFESGNDHPHPHDAPESRPESELQNLSMNEQKEGISPVQSPGDRPRSSSKRKSSQPLRAVDDIVQEEDAPMDGRQPLNRVQELIAMQNRLYLNFMAEKRLSEQQQAASRPPVHNSEERSPGSGTDSETGVKTDIPKDIKNLGQTLKNELASALNSTIDKIFADYLAEAARIAQTQNQMRQQMEAGQNAAVAAAAARSMWSPFYPNLCQYPGFGGPAASMAPSIFPGFAPGQMPNNPAASFMTAAAGTPFGGSPGVNLRKESAMDGFSVLTGQSRKKRSKVTDTRLSKMAMRIAGEDSRSTTPVTTGGGGYFPPTMVGHPLYPSFTSLASDDREPSPSHSDAISDMANYESNNNNSGLTCSLTPLHLRKAKLLFFFTRYPSSNMLKSFFPDVRFNKNTTAQLVKWFSNFREFYYIQMDKYARQAQQEGIVKAEDIIVTPDSEIYRVINQHYNRNNHIQVPSNFCGVVQATLREFYLAIVAGKDAESSWKKQIYKVIARLDDAIPEYFKNPNFIEQLE